MTYKQYQELEDHITREYDFASYRKTKAQVYGLEWTAEDEANYQKWYASYLRITDWATDVMAREVANHDYEIFKVWAIGE